MFSYFMHGESIRMYRRFGAEAKAGNETDPLRNDLPHHYLFNKNASTNFWACLGVNRCDHFTRSPAAPAPVEPHSA